MKKLYQYLSFILKPNKLTALEISASIHCIFEDKVSDCQVYFIEGKTLYCHWDNHSKQVHPSSRHGERSYKLNVSYGALDLSFPCRVEALWEAHKKSGVKLKLGPFNLKNHWQLLKLRWSILNHPLQTSSKTKPVNQAA